MYAEHKPEFAQLADNAEIVYETFEILRQCNPEVSDNTIMMAIIAAAGMLTSREKTTQSY